MDLSDLTRQDVLALPHGQQVLDMWSSWPIYSGIKQERFEKIEQAYLVLVKNEEEYASEILFSVIVDCLAVVSDEDSLTPMKLKEFYQEAVKKFS